MYSVCKQVLQVTILCCMAQISKPIYCLYGELAAWNSFQYLTSLAHYTDTVLARGTNFIDCPSEGQILLTVPRREGRILSTVPRIEGHILSTVPRSEGQSNKILPSLWGTVNKILPSSGNLPLLYKCQLIPITLCVILCSSMWALMIMTRSMIVTPWIKTKQICTVTYNGYSYNNVFNLYMNTWGPIHAEHVSDLVLQWTFYM